MARYRDRHHLSGAKSDAGDAKLLADLVRTDRHNHRPIAGDSADAEAIKVLARAHQSLIWSRTRHTNALRNALREYYPAALVAFDDLAHGDALGSARSRPNPRTGRSSEPVGYPFGAQTRWAPTQYRRPRPSGPSRAGHRAAGRAGSGQYRVCRHHPRHGGHHHRTEPPDQRARTSLAAHFETHPDADIYLSQPGLGVVLGARVLGEFGDDPNRYTDTKSRKNYAGTSPLTAASGRNVPCWPVTCATAVFTTPSTTGPSARYQ